MLPSTNGNDKDLHLHLVVNKLSRDVLNLLYLIGFACKDGLLSNWGRQIK